MNELNNQPAVSGNYVDSDGNIINIVDLLSQGATPVTYDLTTAKNILNRTTPKSGNMVASDGKVYNIVDLVKEKMPIEPIETTNTTVGGYSVPELTDEQIVTIHNEFVKGKSVIIQDANDVYYQILQSDVINDEIQVQILYFDTLIVTYTLDNDTVTITAKKLTTTDVT